MSTAQRARRIDAHQHYWRPARGDYHWMPADGPLHRDYLPADLRPLNAAARIDGTITVQAAQTVGETDWLLQLASDPASGILGVVGWVPLDTTTHATLDLMAAHPACVGVRPMLQDLEQDDWISTQVAREQLMRVAEGELVFEVLSLPRHLPYVVQALEAVPELTVVIDHLSKPVYGAHGDEWAKWAEHMAVLADRPATYCKLSGMVTEAGAGWTLDDFRRHADFILETFGADRVLFGTDWPVCLQVASHAQVVELAEHLTAHLSDTERAAIFGANAERVYGV